MALVLARLLFAVVSGGRYMRTRGRGAPIARTGAGNGSDAGTAPVEIVAEERAVRFDLTVHDDDVYHCFAAEPPEKWEALARRAIMNGVQVLNYSQAVGGADHVAHRFETLARDMDELVRQVLGDALSVDRDSAPLARIKHEME